MNRLLLQAELTIDEGRRGRLYYDTTGHPTIGIGHNLNAKGVSDRVIDLLFEDDVNDVEVDLDSYLVWWRTLDEVRQRVLANMTFNMGITKLLEFQRTLGAVRDGRYSDAAEFMLESRWATQVGERAARLSRMMRTGEIVDTTG